MLLQEFEAQIKGRGNNEEIKAIIDAKFPKATISTIESPPPVTKEETDGLILDDLKNRPEWYRFDQQAKQDGFRSLDDL